MNSEKIFWSDGDKGLLLLRVMFGFLILFHGWHKVVHGIDMPMARMASHGLPGFLIYFAYLSEVVAPILIVLGLFTRLSALALFVTMTVVVYIEVRTGVSLTPQGAISIEIQLIYWFVSAGLFFTGPGRYKVSASSKSNWFFE
jgi:putative oxidoreductase